MVSRNDTERGRCKDGEGRGRVLVVSCWRLTSEVRVESVGPACAMCGSGAWTQVTPRLRFSVVIDFSSAPRGGWTVGPLDVSLQRDNLTPPREFKKK